MYLAAYESSYFMFDAFGATEDDARAALAAGLRAHAKQYRLSPDWYYPEDVKVRAITLGVAYRDSEPLPAA